MLWRNPYAELTARTAGTKGKKWRVFLAGALLGILIALEYSL